MASKSGQQEPEKAEVIEEMLDGLDGALDRVRVLYEQFFLGIQKQPPAHLHAEVERKTRDLTQMQIRNTALRYRFATLTQKLGSYNSYWRRTLRQIENGTYARSLSKIGRQAARTGADVPEEILAAMPKRMREQVKRDREAQLALQQRREKPGEDVEIDVDDLSGEAAAFVGESSDVKRNVLTQNGAHVISEDDGDFDLDAFFDRVTSEGEPDPLPIGEPAASRRLRPGSSGHPLPPRARKAEAVPAEIEDGAKTDVIPKIDTPPRRAETAGDAATTTPVPRLDTAQTTPISAADSGRTMPVPRQGATFAKITTVKAPAFAPAADGPARSAAPPAAARAAVEPPAVTRPSAEPPAIARPALEPPAVTRPSAEPPAIARPAVEPPAMARPAVEPPAMARPAVEPPAVARPAVEPPAIAGARAAVEPAMAGERAAAKTPALGTPLIPPARSPAKTPTMGAPIVPPARPPAKTPATGASIAPPAAAPAAQAADERDPVAVKPPPLPPIKPPMVAPSQASRPTPVAPGASSGRTAIPVETMAGPFPRIPSMPPIPRVDAPANAQPPVASAERPAAPPVQPSDAAPREIVDPPSRPVPPPVPPPRPQTQRVPVSGDARVPPPRPQTQRVPVSGDAPVPPPRPQTQRVPVSGDARVPVSGDAPVPPPRPQTQRVPVSGDARVPGSGERAQTQRVPRPPGERPEPPARQAPPPGMSDADVNALYAKYVQAKQILGEEAGPGAYGKLLKTIHAQAPKIMEQYKSKGVDFSVVVKDNQVIIRAKPKP